MALTDNILKVTVLVKTAVVIDHVSNFLRSGQETATLVDFKGE